MKRHNNTIRFIAVLLIVLLLSTLAVSCKKKDDSAKSGTLVDVPAPDPSKIRGNGSVEEDTASSTLTSVPSTPSVSVSAEIDSSSSVPSSPVFDSVTVSYNEKDNAVPIVYTEESNIPSFQEEVIPEEDGVVIGDGSVYSTSYKYGTVITLEIKAYDTAADITYSPAVSQSDIRAFIAMMVEKSGNMFDGVEYRLDGRTIGITYPESYMPTYEVKEAVIENLLSMLTAELDAYYSTLITETPGEENTYSHDYLLFGRNVHIDAGLDRAVITSDSFFTPEEIEYCAAILSANFEEAQYVTYEANEYCVMLTYPEVNAEYVRAALVTLENLILAYTPSLLASEELVPVEPVANDAIPEEASDVSVSAIGGVDSSQVTVEESANAPEVTTETVAVKDNAEVSTTLPLINDSVAATVTSKAAATLENFNVSISYSGNFWAKKDNKGVYTEKWNNSIGAALEYRLKKDFTVYGKVNLYFDKSFMLIFGARKNIIDNLYIYGGIGVATPSEISGTQLVIESGLGYAYPVTEKLSVFGEAGITYGCGSEDNIIRPTVTLGARYSF